MATRNLQDSIGSSGTNQVFILQSADLVERQAVCGNLVCEAGERPSSVDGSNGGQVYQIYHFLQHLNEYLCAVSLLALSTHSMLLMAHSILHHVSHNQGSVWGISFALSVSFFSAFPVQLQGLKEPFESNPKGMKLPFDSRARVLGCL